MEEKHDIVAPIFKTKNSIVNPEHVYLICGKTDLF